MDWDERVYFRTCKNVLAVVLAAGGVFALSALTQPLNAQTRSGTVVEEIRVVGTQRIDPSTVNAYMQIKPGDKYDPAKVDDSLKNLFNTGLFADVTLRREGDAVVVQVVENPIINRIAFEGNRKLDNEALLSEVSLRPRVVYTRTKVQGDVQRLLDIYRRSGRFAATVDPKVIQLPENRVDLVFEIEEGGKTGIRAINFIGNSEFSDGSLRETIQTTESAFYNFLTSNDTYDPDRLSFDRELLRRFYLSEGYADFRVVSAIAELTEDRDDFIVTFTLDEGPQYNFGTLEVASELRGVEGAELGGLIAADAGDTYDANEVEETIQSITESLGERGFAFVDVRPRVDRDRDALTIDVTYEIREGPRVFVERIDIAGNERTLDEVIRREFTIVEGDAFNTAKLRRTRQRLQDLGFFSRVDINNTPGSANDRTIVSVNVEEQSTGELSIGAGFSSTAGVLTDIALRERNLLGRGQDLRVSTTLATKQQQIDLSFTEPYFLDRDVAAGFDVFVRTTDFSDRSSFEQSEVGFGLRAGYQMTEKLRHTARYRFTRDSIDDIQTDASDVVKAQEGTFTTSSIENDFFFDELDSKFEPTDGYSLSYSVDLAGFGGSEKFLRNEVGANYFVPLFGSSFIGSVGGEAGHLAPLDDDETRISERFFLGGSRLRGFEVGGVGPRDLVTDDSIGGTQYYRGSAEIGFPLGLPEEFDIKGAVFSDMGSVWGSDDPFPNIADDASLRATAGIGISWGSPVGPVRINLARPLMKEDYDKTEFFSFSFGTRF
ncbi:MAG: outer membrane protein assembly factor BamA [Rhodospirillaceae bacterium]|jgi:outer membrane protein insertion porin family|nr:outer membrane protein assembly factor BamA [Rhodospirillaceae bacterium]MBT6534764.1 outer membrane protein assembly factor BamA [Rhodospirillaceae bacterium]